MRKPKTRKADLAADPSPEGARARILLVEDDALSRATMCELLGEEGYEATGVATGAAAVGALRSSAHPFDLVVTDLGLPDVSGAELVRRIRESAPAVPVIVLSGRSVHDPDVAKLLGEPKIAFLQKPIDIDVLVRTIDGLRHPRIR
jgi:DNA-binding response OmpR family regulator